MTNITDLEKEKFGLDPVTGLVGVKLESVIASGTAITDFSVDLEQKKFNSNGEIRTVYSF